MKGYEFFLRFLKNEGFRTNDEGNYFTFRFQGNTFVVFKHDSRFLQVIQVIKAEGYTRSRLLETCDKLNDDKFVVKCTVHDNNIIWCCYETLPNEYTSSDDFELIMTLLDKSTDEFYVMLRN